MKKREIFFSIYILFVSLNLNSYVNAGDFTATSIIQVLPYTEKDPFIFQTPPIDKDIQNQFRNSLAKLIKQPDILSRLLERDKVRETQWFKNLHRTIDMNMSKTLDSAINDLQKNLQVLTEQDNELIEISMTCADEKSAETIVNEVADVFIKARTIQKAGEIRQRLVNFSKNISSVEQEITIYRTSMQNILTTTGFGNLENSDSQPIITRLNRLLAEKDDCFLEIKQLEKEIEIAKSEPNKQNLDDELKKTDKKMKLLKSKLEELEKMCKESEENKSRWDAAHRLYEENKAKELRSANILKELQVAVVKLTIMLTDPLISNLKIVKSATY